MTAPPSVNESVPHGAPTDRNWIFTASVANTRRMISRPSVMTATENSGSPIIGRIVRRSMTRPSSAATPRATNTLSTQCSQLGPPRFMIGFVHRR